MIYYNIYFSLLIYHSALGETVSGMQGGAALYEDWEHALQSQSFQGSQSLHNYTGCLGLLALFGYNGNLANFPLA